MAVNPHEIATSEFSLIFSEILLREQFAREEAVLSWEEIHIANWI